MESEGEQQREEEWTLFMCQYSNVRMVEGRKGRQRLMM